VLLPSVSSQKQPHDVVGANTSLKIGIWAVKTLMKCQ